MGKLYVDENLVDRKETDHYYQQFAADFEKIPFDPLIQQLVGAYAKAPNSIFDVGSGPGALAKALQDEGFSVTCLDPVAEMIRRCREKGLDGVLGTLEKVDEQYQIVLAISSLIHVSYVDFKLALKQIHEKLLPGGKLIISMLIGDGEKMEDPLEKGCERYFKYYSEDELQKIFLEQGFRIVEEHARESNRMQKRFAIYVLEPFQS